MATLLLLSGPAAWAQTAGSYFASAVTIVDPGCNGFFEQMQDTGTGPGPVIVGTGGGRNCNGSSASGSATAQAGFNFVAASSGSAGGLGGGGISTAGAGSTSTFVVANPNLTGTQGKLLFGFNVNGSAGAAASDNSSAFAIVQYGLQLSSAVDSFGVDENWTLTNDGPPVGGLSFGTQLYEVGFVFGQVIQFDLGVILDTGSSSGAEGSATAVAAFGNTFAWDGIVDVLDATGAPVADFTALDVYGNDWSLPHVSSVPAPAGIWTMLAGLGTVLAWRRRRA